MLAAKRAYQSCPNQQPDLPWLPVCRVEAFVRQISSGIRQYISGGFRLIFSRGLGGVQFGLGFGKVFLKRIALLHLSHNGLGQDTSGVDIRRVMPRNFNTVPADGAGFSNDGVVLVGKKIGKDQGQNHGFGGMSAGIAEAFFQFAGGETGVEDIRARAFVVILGIVGHGLGVLLHAVKECFGLREFTGQEKTGQWPG